MQVQRFLAVLLWWGVAQTVGAQQFPDYIEKQIKQGALTRAEAKLLYGNLASKTAVPNLATAPKPEAKEPKKDEKKEEKKKEPPYRGTIGLTTSDLTPGAINATIYLLKDTPELQEQLTKQKNLIASLQRSGSRPPSAIGGIPGGAVGGEPGLSKVAAARAQVSGYEAIAASNAPLAQTTLLDGKFALEADVPSGIIMAIARAGDQILGVWAVPAKKDEPLTLERGNALYPVPGAVLE